MNLHGLYKCNFTISHLAGFSIVLLRRIILFFVKKYSFSFNRYFLFSADLICVPQMCLNTVKILFLVVKRIVIKAINTLNITFMFYTVHDIYSLFRTFGCERSWSASNLKFNYHIFNKSKFQWSLNLKAHVKFFIFFFVNNKFSALYVQSCW